MQSNHVKTSRISIPLLAYIGTLLISSHSLASDYSVGLDASTDGLLLGISGKSDVHFVNNDNIQWRLSGGGAFFDNSEVEINDISYEKKSKLETKNVKFGYEWFPLNSDRIAGNLFLAGGVSYENDSFDGKSDTTQQQKIGSITTTPGDGRQVHLEVDQEAILPYVSVGWGNRLTNTSGFFFRAEVGAKKAVSDYDVTFKSVGNTSISQADLNAEKRKIEDDLNGVRGFVSLGVAYQF